MIHDPSRQSTDHMQEREKLNKVQHMFSLKLNIICISWCKTHHLVSIEQFSTKWKKDSKIVLCTLIGPENLSHLLSQSDAKQKAIALSCTSGSLFDMFSLWVLIGLCSDWSLRWLFTGSGFLTLKWKLVYNTNYSKSTCN